MPPGDHDPAGVAVTHPSDELGRLEPECENARAVGRCAWQAPRSERGVVHPVADGPTTSVKPPIERCTWSDRGRW